MIIIVIIYLFIYLFYNNEFAWWTHDPSQPISCPLGLRYILLEGNQVRLDFLSFYFLTFLCKRKYTCIWGRISLLLVKQIMSPFPFCEFNSVEVWLDLERGRKEMTDYLLFIFFFFQAVSQGASVLPWEVSA